MGSLVGEYDAGWALSGSSELASVVDECLAKPNRYEQKCAGAHKLAAEQLWWTTNAEKLLEFIQSKPATRDVATDFTINSPDSCNYCLDRDTNIYQEFTIRQSNFSGVEFRIFSEFVQSKKRIFATLSKVEKDCSITFVSTATYDIDSSDNMQWQYLELPIQHQSSGNRYRLELSTDAEPEEKLAVWVSRGNPFPMGQLCYKSRNIKHNSMSIRTFYHVIDH